MNITHMNYKGKKKQKPKIIYCRIFRSFEISTCHLSK